MALYSYCLHKKGREEEYKRIGNKNELAFLDYFAMQFNDKDEFMNFLEVDLNLYDDIKICYCSNHGYNVLPIFFDSPELEAIATSMLDLSKIDDFPLIIKLALGYDKPEILSFRALNPSNVYFEDIFRMIISDNIVADAYKKGYIHEKLFRCLDNHDYLAFKMELARSYLNVRKVYLYLRGVGIIESRFRGKPSFPFTITMVLDDLKKIDSKQKYEIYSQTNLTSYEEILIEKIINGDEKAYEELMALGTERLEQLTLIISYLNDLRASRQRREI